MRRLILVVLLSGAGCFAQTMGDAAAVNAGNLAGHTMNNYGVAPGSRFALLGTGLANAAAQETFPLATQLGGASVKVTVGDFTADCWVVATQPDRVTAVLPSATPPGDGTVTLTNGPISATTKIHVVAVALGLPARNQSELGPAFAFHDNTNPVTLLDAAQAGENVTIRGTGLGAVSGDEGAGPIPTDMSVPLEVRVGGIAANVVAARRSAALAGIDEIVVEIPAGVQGCSVPVAMRAAGAITNYVTLPVHDGGGDCSDSFGLTGDALANLPSDHDTRIGIISLTRTNVSTGVEQLITDSGHLLFSSYSVDQLSSRRGFNLAATPGTCVVLSISGTDNAPSVDPVTGRDLSVGTVTITGPKGTKTIDPSNAGELGRSFTLGIPNLPPGVPLPPLPAQGDTFLEPGGYTISATSSRDVGAFSVSFNLPAAVAWTNQPAFPDGLNKFLPRDQDLLFQWKNGGDQDVVLMQGLALASEFTGAAFLCTEWANKGSFTVPSFVLQSLPASGANTVGTNIVGGAGFLSMATVAGNPGRFKNDQIDLGLVTFSTAALASIGGWR